MDLSGLKWPLIIVAIVGIGWLGTSGGIQWMYGNFTKAAPGVDVNQDIRDEAGLTKLAGYTYFLWKWKETIAIIETSMERYGDGAPNYWYNMERLSNCYDRIGNYKMSLEILELLMRARAWEVDPRVPNREQLNLRANTLREMHELR